MLWRSHWCKTSDPWPVGKGSPFHYGGGIYIILKKVLWVYTSALVVYTCIQLKNPEVIVVAQLELWDAGEKSLQKFDHILPACLKSTNGTLLFFSYEDRYVLL